MLVVCVLAVGGSVAIAARVRFDNSFEAYFDTEDSAYQAYNLYREDFGSDEIAYLLYSAPKSRHGIFDLEVMRLIDGLTRELEEEVPFVKEVTSLANAEFVEGVPGGLEIHPLLDEFPTSQEELAELGRKALSKPLYVGGLVSADAAHAAIILEMDRASVDPIEALRLDADGGDGLANLYPQVSYHAIEAILARPEYADLVFHHVGDVPLNAVYNEVSSTEGARLTGITLGVIGLLLLFFFRRAIGVLGPLCVVLLAVMASIAFVGLMGWTLDLMFTMLPTLLIAVGVADAVHLITEFRAHHVELGDRREAARRTLALVGTPCLLTSLTTAAGFLSMSISPIQAISHLAVYAAVGVMAAFLLSVTLLFVLLSLGPRRPARAASADEVLRARGGRRFQRALSAVTDFDLRWRGPIIAGFAGLFVFSALGIARLQVDSNFINEFGEDIPVRRSTEYVDEIMGGTYSFVYLFDSGVADGIKDPALLRDMDRLQTRAAFHETVVKSYSLGDVLKDINRAFHEEDLRYHVLPEERNLVAQYLLLYEMSGGEEVEEYVSGDFARASLELRVKAAPTSELAEVAADLDRHLVDHAPQASKVSVTGVGVLWLKLQEYITHSQIRGFLLAFSVIAAFLCFIFRSVKIGLLAMIPNLSPVVLTLGVMGWLEIPLDYVRLMIGGVAMGISVDDTIHHVTRFLQEFKRCGRYEEALRVSMSDVGRALVITSVALVTGFLVFLVSSLDTLALFGALLATTVGVALLADFLLMPALVVSFRAFGPERRQA